MVPKWCPDVKNKVVKRKTAIITRYKKSLCLQGFSQITYKKICGNTGRFWLFHDPRNQFASNRTWVRIPSSPPKTQSYQGFCQYDWAFLFSQGHIGVHDFRQELRCASRSAPAASPAPPAGNRPQYTAASWGAPPCRRGEGKQIHFDGVFQCLVDYFFSRHPNLGKLGLTKGRIYAIHE